MKFTIDEFGIPMPDVKIKDFLKEKIKSLEDIHTSQLLVLDCFRAEMLDIPIDLRPIVEWEAYGVEFHMDKDMRSFDAWRDARMQVFDNALNKIAGWK